MRENEGQAGETSQNRTPFPVLAIWDQLGVTEHLGGLAATRRLLEFWRVTPWQRVLDLGCGTGCTACLLAKRYQVEVIAADISPSVLAWARKRVEEQGVSEHVTLVEADAHALPFPEGTCDAVIAESVLVFCDQPCVSAEVFRVLKRGGLFGDNELTYLNFPPPQWRTLLASIFGTALRPLLADEWAAVFREAGFSEVASTLYKIRLLEQFRSHLQVDGISRYFSTLYRGVADPTVRSAFFNKDVFQAARRFCGTHKG
jgi:arsenite methyltransferase